MKYFTITTYEHAGLGDQLGTQFIRLYKIGQNLGLEYKHKGFNINRSCNSKYQIRVQGTFTKIKIKLINWNSKNGRFNLFLNVFLILEKLLLKLDHPYLLNKKLIQFLGINGSQSIQGTAFKPNLFDEITQSNSSEELSNRLLNLIEKSKSDYLDLIWHPKYYEISYKLDKLYNQGKTINENVFLKHRFYLNKQINDENILNKKFVIHIRCGDSVLIKSKTGSISIYGTEITFLDNENEKKLKGDLNRKSLGTEKYLNVLNSLFLNEKTEVILLSDGYDLSKKIIADFYINYNNKLEQNQKKILVELLNTDLNNEILIKPFEKFCKKFVIGESFINLKKSFIELCLADVLFFGTGGFSYYIHSIYRRNNNSFLGHANEVPEILKTEINKKLNNQ